MSDGAVRGLMDAKRRGKRGQRVYTPQCVVDVLLATWPEGVMCDPCSGPASIVPAAIRIMPPQNGCRYVTKIPTLDADGEPLADAEGDLVYQKAPPGLVSWPRRTYINPEFSDLAAWLRQFAESDDVIALAPVRCHRRWWRAAMRGATVAELDPIAFVGHTHKFPAPLALAYRGPRTDAFHAAIATSKIGEIR